MSLEAAARKFTQKVADHIQQHNPNIIVLGSEWEVVVISADMRVCGHYVYATLSPENEGSWLPFLEENKEKIVSKLFGIGWGEVVLFFEDKLPLFPDDNWRYFRIEYRSDDIRYGIECESPQGQKYYRKSERFVKDGVFFVHQGLVVSFWGERAAVFEFCVNQGIFPIGINFDGKNYTATDNRGQTYAVRYKDDCTLQQPCELVSP
jgi:hypothetical protein